MYAREVPSEPHQVIATVDGTKVLSLQPKSGDWSVFICCVYAGAMGMKHLVQSHNSMAWELNSQLNPCCTEVLPSLSSYSPFSPDNLYPLHPHAKRV